MFREAFTVASAKPQGSSGVDFLEAIFHERPDLKEKTAYFPGQGQKAHTVILGNEVFKGPRRPDGEYKDDFDTECTFLKALETSGLPVPRITALGKDFLFLGMTKMPGVVMPSVHTSALSQQEQHLLAQDLINFVIAMAHALPMQGEKFAMHDDLWNANILIDPESKRLTGIIDFGKVAYKTADEWAPMYDFEGSAFYQIMQEEFDTRKSDLPTPEKQIAYMPITSKIARTP